MPDEENDKIIKDAADHYHPVYDDKAWEKMEQLLDQHLPQEKKRRKIIFFLLPLLLAGGMVFYMVAENGGKNPPLLKGITTSTTKTEKPIPALLPPGLSGAKIADSSSGKQESYLQPPVRKENALEMPRTNSGKNITSAAHTNSIYPVEKHTQENNFNNNIIPLPDETIMKQEKAVNNHDKNCSAVSLSDQKNIVNQENKQDTLLHIPVVKETETIAKNEEAKSTAIKKKIKKSKNNFAKNFGISISVGPDISGVHLDNPGRVAINFGLGFNYFVSPSFTLRAGFYAVKKIYSVGPDDYKTTAGTGNYDYLENIDANCIVYSIPVNINYNFKKVKNHNWFLSTGLSSYLMKREAYEFYYKYPSGQTNTKDWIIHNQNQNFLSLLNLSGGYQYSFNNKISVMAESYVNLPLSGVGAGKVKLKSSGILFTLTVKPFLKKDK